MNNHNIHNKSQENVHIHISSGKNMNIGVTNILSDNSIVSSEDNNQESNNIPDDLIQELSQFFNALKKEVSNDEHYGIISEVKKAKDEAIKQQGSLSRIKRHLSKSGKWGLKIAEKIGTQVVAGIIKSEMGV